MSDRLAQLRRQRALAEEQLDWINRELAAAERASGHAPAIPCPAPTQPALAVGPPPQSVHSDSAIDGSTRTEDEIIARYRVEPDRLKHDVKKGCLFYFVAALALLAAGVVILYFSLRPR